jgi:hypothetical protein
MLTNTSWGRASPVKATLTSQPHRHPTKLQRTTIGGHTYVVLDPRNGDNSSGWGPFQTEKPPKKKCPGTFMLLGEKRQKGPVFIPGTHACVHVRRRDAGPRGHRRGRCGHSWTMRWFREGGIQVCFSPGGIGCGGGTARDAARFL